MNKIKIKDVIIFAIISIVVLSMIIVPLLGQLPIKKNVDKIVSGIIFEEDAVLSSWEEAYVLIEGTYTDYVFNWWHDDEFAGKIIVSDTPNLPEEVIDECRDSMKCISRTENDDIFEISYYMVTETGIKKCTGKGYFNSDSHQLAFLSGYHVAVFPATNIDDALYTCMVLSDGLGYVYSIHEWTPEAYPGWRTQEN